VIQALALDTSTELCTVAVGLDKRIYQSSKMLSRRHNDEILPMIQDIVQTNAVSMSELSHIVYINGPGSFTGLRIASSVAKGLAMSLDIPIIALSSLQVMAMHMYNIGVKKCRCVLSSHANVVYLADYVLKDGVPVLISDIKILSLANLDIFTDEGVLVNLNKQASTLLEQPTSHNIHYVYPKASDMLLIARKQHNLLATNYLHDSMNYVNDYLIS
jgi:tRNA threonylcarbamoyladenosine biosynthesis protein TsaB